MDRHLKLSEKACYKASQISPEYGEAYLFAKTLASLTKHPILLNFSITATRLLLNYSDRKFRQLLNTAFKLNLVRMEGKHLRIFSRSDDRKEFGKQTYCKIKLQDATKFYQYSILKNNITKQAGSIKYKTSVRFKRIHKTFSEVSDNNRNLHVYKTVNTEITLSVRSIAKLLNVSASYAHTIAKKLKSYGLALIQNRVEITKKQFEFYKSIGKHNARFDKGTGKFFYLKASIPKFTDFYKPVGISGAYNSYINGLGNH